MKNPEINANKLHPIFNDIQVLLLQKKIILKSILQR